MFIAALEHHRQPQKGKSNENLLFSRRIFLPIGTWGIQRPPGCTHLVFKDDFDEQQQQLREEDDQKDPEELRRERQGSALLPWELVVK